MSSFRALSLFDRISIAIAWLPISRLFLLFQVIRENHIIHDISSNMSFLSMPLKIRKPEDLLRAVWALNLGPLWSIFTVKFMADAVLLLRESFPTFVLAREVGCGRVVHFLVLIEPTYCRKCFGTSFMRTFKRLFPMGLHMQIQGVIITKAPVALGTLMACGRHVLCHNMMP